MMTLTFWQLGKAMGQLSTDDAVLAAACPCTSSYQPRVNLFGSQEEVRLNKRGTTFFAESKGSLEGLKL
ncbi:MAG: hypothetical protein JO316_19935 [Abitibacteriaceae bacterium]|nr:hypothetical protein [Abditibacteriaceae bacterium]